jgi:SAM-dependent methyltransferase
MEPGILPFLICPLTRQSLRPLTAADRARLNERVRAGELRLATGQPLREEIEAGLIAADRSFAYLEKDGVAFLTREWAIPLAGQASGPELHANKKQVRDFYDQFGWEQEDGAYKDTCVFVDTRACLQDYYLRCKRRAHGHLSPRGKFFLDAASGPLAWPDLIELASGYEFRVCVDISFRALCEARKKLGPRGIYLLADITALPLADNCMDAVVSLHPIYHVPADEQATAIRELHRVVRPGSAVVIAYHFGGESPAMKFMRAVKHGLLWPRKLFRSTPEAPAAEPAIYFFAHDWRWLTTTDFGGPTQILCFQSFGNAMFKAFVHERLGGRYILRAVSILEDWFPLLLGRIGEYPLILVRKD